MRGNRWERILERSQDFNRRFEPGAKRGHGDLDYISKDGSAILELKSNLMGARDLYGAAIQLARYLVKLPQVRKAYLLAITRQLSSKRAAEELALLRKVLNPQVAQRIEIVLVGPHEVFPSSPHPQLGSIVDELRKEMAVSQGESPDHRSGSALFEVVKLLFRQALLKEKPFTLQDLKDTTGYSYSSVSNSVRELEALDTAHRVRGGAIELHDFSLRSLTFMARHPNIRPVRLLVDATGRKQDNTVLWHRVRPWLNDRLAAGGVPAGRHWDPRLDLHGLPRLDLHAVDPRSFRMQELGLAHAPKHVGPERVVVALHRVTREKPLFVREPNSGIFWADPVETILDLYELQLVDQAEALIQRMRSSKK